MGRKEDRVICGDQDLIRQADIHNSQATCLLVITRPKPATFPKLPTILLIADVVNSTPVVDKKRQIYFAFLVFPSSGHLI
jgi:hypothetical protein